MLSIFGLIVIIVIGVFTFRTAKENGRKAGLWTFAAIGAGIVIQIIIPMIIAVIAVIYMAMTGSSEAELRNFDPGWLTWVSIIFILLGTVAAILILRHVSKIPEDENLTMPPPPTSFNLNE